MEIINFDQVYEDEVIALWNRTMIHDLISKARFEKQILLDENFDRSLCLLALDEGRVAGFILGIKRKFPYLERGLEPERGWISVMFTAPEAQGKGVGTALEAEVEKRLAAMGAKNITLAAYSPNYFFPGVDLTGYPKTKAFFEDLGYKAGESSWSMCKDLHDFYISPEWQKKKEAAEEKGFCFRPFRREDTLDILDFAKDNFGGGWKRNLLMAMQAGEAEDVVTVVTYHDEIAGFAMRKIDGNPMRFGPIGVAEKFRDSGIGGILFEVKQEEMVSKGFYHLFFLSTDVPGRRFYERHGVKPYREYTKYDKKLE